VVFSLAPVGLVDSGLRNSSSWLAIVLHVTFTFGRLMLGSGAVLYVGTRRPGWLYAGRRSRSRRMRVYCRYRDKHFALVMRVRTKG